MANYQTTPRRDANKQGAVARRLIASTTVAAAGTALYQDLTENVVARTDNNGQPYFLVASELASHRYYGIRKVGDKWISSNDQPQLMAKLIRQVEQYCAAQAA